MNKKPVMYAIYLLLILPILLGSCCTSKENARVKYLLSDPALSVDIQNAVVHGELIKGMRYNDVKASWGKPDPVVRGVRVNNEDITR